ncbi:MAG: hypothetical protein IPL61_06285 [Myxococcales bacterium]|nr:hypothetical protein [Myxococcales bacterium]
MTDGAVKKHRHDLGQEDHGPVLAAGTTRAIQGLLGLWIAATLFALVWAMVDAGHGPTPPASPTATEVR